MSINTILSSATSKFLRPKEVVKVAESKGPFRISLAASSQGFEYLT